MDGVDEGGSAFLMLSSDRQHAHERETVLNGPAAWLRVKRVDIDNGSPGGRKPIAVESLDEHDLAVADIANLERGNPQAGLFSQQHGCALNAWHVEGVLAAGELGQPQHAGVVAYRSFGPRSSERGAIDEDGLEVRWHRKPFLDAVCRLHKVDQIVRDIVAMARTIIDGRPDVERAHAVTTCVQQVLGLREAIGRHLELGFDDAPAPGVRRGVADASEQREVVGRQQPLTENLVEVLLNAVAHRDYRLGGSMFVRQFAQRLEVVSPGGFPPGITPANVLDQQSPRNRRLAEALARCGLIERSGQGMNLMFERAIRQGKPLPDFTGTSSHEVRLCLSGLIGDPAFVRFMERLGEETLRGFSTHDFLVLDHLHRERPLNEVLRSRLPRLVEMGAVEPTGRGKGTRYLLSHRLYEAMGAKGVYTRKKGLDRDTNKALLVRHIARNKVAGARMAEFQQVLPSLSRSEIQVLVRELAADQAIHKRGVTRAARWYPGPPPADCNPGGPVSNSAT